MKTLKLKKSDNVNVKTVIKNIIDTSNKILFPEKNFKTNITKHNNIESQSYYGLYRRSFTDYILYCDFFNMVYNESIKINNLKIEYVIEADNSILSSMLSDGRNRSVKIVLIDYCGDKFMFRIQTSFDNNNIYCIDFSLSSKNKTLFNYKYVYEYIKYCVYIYSQYKSNIIKNVGDEYLNIEISNLDSVNMSELFFPEKNKKYIDLFINTFKLDGNVLRYLLVGNPGTGKTQLGVALANELKNIGVTIIQTKINKTFDDVVKLAINLAPSLILIDDIDLSLGDRNGFFNSKLLEIFLNTLDGSNEIPKNVGFICSTNALEMLDIAAQRPERFNKLLEFGVLDKESIKKIIIKSLSKNFSEEVINRNKSNITHTKIIDLLYDEKVTGAYIYNITKMTIELVEKVLQDKVNIDYNYFYDNIKEDLEELNRMKSNNYLSDKVHNNSEKNGMGFGSRN